LNSKFQKRLGRLGTAGPGSMAPKPPPAADETPRQAKVRNLRAQLDRLVAKDKSRLVEKRRALQLGGESTEDTFARLLRTAEPAPGAICVEDHRDLSLPGALVETRHGPVHLVQQHLEPHHCHGRVPVVRGLEAPAALTSRLALDPTLADVDLSKMLFIDTETTGLSTASGTLAFLVGIARFDDQSLYLEQMLLRGHHDEPAMLRHLAEHLGRASCIVSYNGKSFDWPLLRTRFVMNRVPAPPLPPHLDLLHCARRLFKKRLGSLRLVQMEREILGFTREHDVDGSEIPGIFLTYLRSGRPGRLDGVIEHNANDLVALAAFLGEIVRHYQDVVREDDPLDHLSYAQVAERAKDPERARQFALAAAAGGGDTDCTVDAFLLAARVARRIKDVAAEHAALTGALEHAPADPRVHLELAKHHEHRAKDLIAALHHARVLDDEHRIARLERRIGRTDGSLP